MISGRIGGSCIKMYVGLKQKKIENTTCFFMPRDTNKKKDTAYLKQRRINSERPCKRDKIMKNVNEYMPTKT